MVKTKTTRFPKKTKRQPIRSLHAQSLLVALVALVVAGGAIYTTTHKNNYVPPQIAEISNASGTVNYSLVTTSTTLKPLDTATISINFDATGPALNAASVELNYDSNLIEVIKVERNSKFATELSAAKIENNKISFTYGAAVGANTGLNGQGTIATIFVKAKQAGIANITFSDTSLALVEDVATNSLHEIQNLALTIADPQSSATTNPSVASSSDPSITPSTEPSLSPSPTPSPSPSYTPSKPSSPNNLRYNCYSNGSWITLRWDEVNSATSYNIVLDQQDGNNDLSATASRNEKDLEIKSNTSYTFKVASIKDSVSSEYTSIKDVKCSSNTLTSPTPSPSPTLTPTPSPTPAPTKKSISQAVSSLFKVKSPSPSPTPKTVSPSPIASFVPASPISSPGNLSDIFTPSNDVQATAPTSNNSTSIISKIFLGWQALFLRLVESLGR